MVSEVIKPEMCVPVKVGESCVPAIFEVLRYAGFSNRKTIPASRKKELSARSEQVQFMIITDKVVQQIVAKDNQSVLVPFS